MEIKDIKTNRGYSTIISYVPVGTIGWLKTKEGEVRQVKLVKIEWVSSKEGCNHARYEWKVAGLKEHYFGTHNTLSIGTIYETEFYAQHGGATHCNYKGVLCDKWVFNIYGILEKKYGVFPPDDRFDCAGTWGDFLSISTIAMAQDGTMPIQRNTPFCVEIDSDGIRAWIPSVDNGTRFLTREAALASYKPKKSITFEDEEEEIADEEEKTITLKVEVKESDFQMIKHMIKVVD